MFEGFSNFYTRPPGSGGGKEPMADAPPAAPIDMKALGEAIATSVKSAVDAAVKPLADNQQALASALAKLPAATPAAEKDKPADAGKPLTAEDVGKIVGEQLKGFQQQQSQSAERTRFQQDKLKDLPEVYRNQLGNDPAKWAAEEQAIRDRYKADFKAAGGKVEDVGGEQPGGQAPAASLDLSKNSPVQNIALGLRDAKPAGPQGTATVRTQVEGAAGAAAGAAK